MLIYFIIIFNFPASYTFCLRRAREQRRASGALEPILLLPFVHFACEPFSHNNLTTRYPKRCDALEQGRTERALASLATAQRARAACIAALTSLATVEAMALEYSTRSVVDAASFLRLALRQAAPLIGSCAQANRPSADAGEDVGEDVGVGTISPLQSPKPSETLS